LVHSRLTKRLRKGDAIYDTAEAYAPERALLVGVTRTTEPSNNHLDELAQLALTAGAEVLDRIVQNRRTPDPGTFIGKGKVEELKRAVRHHGANLVIFDDDLTAAQVRTIEREVDVKIIDRSALILDIFARHARTREAKLQVELAQLQYLLPRLTRLWTHLSRTGGGIGTRGPGETQLEVDRRRIGTRISRLKKKLEGVRVERETQRKQRGASFRVSLVGYTNAGKSTLFNALTRAEVPVAPMLFATLDTTTRKLYLRDGVSLLLSDTVGFIRKLPHHLVASFRSTLEDVTEADLLLHVADASSPQLGDQIEAVDTVLKEIVANSVPQRIVLNKTDMIEDNDQIYALRARFPDATFLSALDRSHVEVLRGQLADAWEAWSKETTSA